jgi:lipid A oxidase
MRPLRFLVTIGAVLVPAVAAAEFQISVYGGMNAVTDNDATLDLRGSSTDLDIDWSGDSFEFPPYWGLRGTYWLSEVGRSNWGVGVDFTHAKAVADLDDPAVGAVFDRLEFTNGINSVTLNGFYRAPINDRFTLYAGAGVGASVPHVEIRTIAPATETFEYQVTGPVIQALAGASVGIWHGLSAFGEYKASYSWNDVDLNGGGNLETDMLVHHFALGLSYSFGGTSVH